MTGSVQCQEMTTSRNVFLMTHIHSMIYENALSMHNLSYICPRAQGTVAFGLNQQAAEENIRRDSLVTSRKSRCELNITTCTILNWTKEFEVSDAKLSAVIVWTLGTGFIWFQYRNLLIQLSTVNFVMLCINIETEWILIYDHLQATDENSQWCSFLQWIQSLTRLELCCGCVISNVLPMNISSHILM